MKKFSRIKFLFLLVLSLFLLYRSQLVIAGEKALNRYKIYSPMSSLSDARPITKFLLKNNFDIAGMNWRKGEIEVITTDEGIEFLEKNGFKGKVIERKKVVIALRGNKKIIKMVTPTDIDPRYLTPAKVEEKLKALNEAFPKITKLVKIGGSHQGRPILALLVSSTPDLDDASYWAKPTILFDGMHHAREIMTPEIVLDVAESLLKGVSSQSRKAREMVSEWNVWVVPMLNTDGNNIVWTTNNWWRKNARSESENESDGSEGKVFGVDINRNYPFYWDKCGGSSGNKNSDIYRGPTGGSEPETQALVRLADKIRPTAALSYHSYSELVIYPFGCNKQYSAEKALFEKVGQELAERLPSDSIDTDGGHYSPGTPWQLLYSVDGDSMGYMHGALGAFAFTFEVNQEFQPPYELRDPTVKKQRVAWRYFMERISNNLLTVHVIDETTGKPAKAMVAVDAIRHENGEKPFMTNEGGNFFKVLDPGRYVVGAKLEDGRTTQAVVEMQGRPHEITLSVKE